MWKLILKSKGDTPLFRFQHHYALIRNFPRLVKHFAVDQATNAYKLFSPSPKSFSTMKPARFKV